MEYNGYWWPGRDKMVLYDVSGRKLLGADTFMDPYLPLEVLVRNTPSTWYTPCHISPLLLKLLEK